ncbi:paraquat-inducible protein A [Oceaniglobus indicus]|uniref:paraquat-inducible protein A n=1 Tax=Oceaniglobus indicus TaxID=2047749 RepID=UPI001F4E95D0|nr:paraquat-inducible protein A [Oceaniglobus indicus]
MQDADASEVYREGELIACPQCDALYRVVPLAHGERAQCVRCGTVLISTRNRAFVRVIALAITVVILMIAATIFPFLSVSVAGLTNSSSVLDAALAFAGGPMFGLSLAVAALIVAIPILRAALVIYVLTPMAFGRAPWPGAIPAFRFSEALRPWSMAEIFVIGVAVALVKVADLARIGFGPAFWFFAALVVVIVLKDGYMNRWTVWKALDQQDRS